MGLISKHLTSLVIGALAVGGVAYAGAEVVTTSSDVVLTQEQPAQEPAEPGAVPQDGTKGERRGGPLRRAVRGELVVEGRDGGFQNVKIDRGTLKSVDGATLAIDEADGTSVSVETNDETRIRRNGRQASVSDLQAGDHVMTVRVSQDGDFVTKVVRAFSKEGIEQLQQRREERRGQRPMRRFQGSEQQLS